MAKAPGKANPQQDQQRREGGMGGFQHLPPEPTDIAPTRDERRVASPDEAIVFLRNALLDGQHWYAALLGAINRWDHPTERLNGEWYTYILRDEALDCLLLAERLAVQVWDLLPQQEVADLLFHGTPPIPLTEEQVKELLGPWKYRAYLNFFYGVVIEEALLFATEQEIRHENSAGVYFDGQRDDAYERIYGATQRALLAEFRDEPRALTPVSLDYAEWKDFVYWLFKRRLEYCLPARVASDTKKAIAELRRQYAATGRSVYRLWVDPALVAAPPR